MNEGDRITIQNLTWGGLQVCSTAIEVILLDLTFLLHAFVQFILGFPNAYHHETRG